MTRVDLARLSDVTDATNHLTDPTDAHDASAISFSPAGSIAATNVQAAIEEVATEAAAPSIAATIFDAKGDIIAASAADVATRLAVGADGAVLAAASGQATGLTWQPAPVCVVVRRSNVGSNLTSTATTFANMDATNLTATMTTLARRVRLTITGVMSNSGTGANALAFSVDGTIVTPTGTSDRGIVADGGVAASSSRPMQATFLTDVLSAGSHTFKPMWKTTSGTMTAYQTAATDQINFYAEETLLPA
jgi:hypothetical protein